MKSSKNGSLPSDDTSFDHYESLVSAEIELIQRVNEIRQNFSSSDSERIVEPILQRISKIKSEKSNLEKKLNLN
ncbi:MAG: hypothetical protein HN384_03760 [Nitrosopumilus sp.]|jgi:hypothetical protein|nr:hypothetical protein [Nitrosopumilus sp.]